MFSDFLSKKDTRYNTIASSHLLRLVRDFRDNTETRTFLSKKKLNAAKPSERLNFKGLGVIGTLAVRIKALRGIERHPQCNHIESIL